MRIFINNRNYLTWPKKMADTLSNQGHDVTIIDNYSLYKPLLAWYEKCPYKLVLLPRNVGHLAPWTEGIVPKDEPYVVTDPDLDVSHIPDDWPERLLQGLELFPDQSKVGFSLEDWRVPTENPAHYADEFFLFPDSGHPTYWKESEHEGWLSFPIDTTFALYRAGVTQHIIDGKRTDRPYTAIHLPWHIVEELNPKEPSLQIKLDDEIAFYFKNASSASMTKARMARMLSRYSPQG
jgi:hypothetical protein